MPQPRDHIELDYSRWQQNLIGILQPEIEYIRGVEKRKYFVFLPNLVQWFDRLTEKGIYLVQ